MQFELKTLGILFLLGACLGVCLYHSQMPGFFSHQEGDKTAWPQGQVLMQNGKRERDDQSEAPYTGVDQRNEMKFECPVDWTNPGGPDQIDEPQQNFLHQHFCWWCQNLEQAKSMSRR